MIKKYFIRMLENNVLFTIILLGIILFGVYRAYLGFYEGSQFRKNLQYESNQQVICGNTLKIDKEFYTSVRQGGTLKAKFFVLQSNDQGWVYFNYYPNDLERLKMKHMSFPIKKSMCINYVKFKDNLISPVITKIEFHE